MTFGKIFERKPENSHTNREEICRIKNEIENEDRIFEEELPAKYSLLQQFTMDHLKRLCIELLGREPPIEEYCDPMGGGMKKLPSSEEDYLFFIIDELRLSEIKNYAIRNGIVTEEFFKSTTNGN